MDLHSGMMFLGMQRARTASGDLYSFKVAFGKSARLGINGGREQGGGDYPVE